MRRAGRADVARVVPPAFASPLAQRRRKAPAASRTGSGAGETGAFVQGCSAKPKVYLLACAHFCIIASIDALSFWLPIIVKSEGVDDTILLGWYTAIPYVAVVLTGGPESHR